MINAREHTRERHGPGNVVVLVAVGAREIASPDGDDVGLNRMIGGRQSADDHLKFAPAAVDSFRAAA